MIYSELFSGRALTEKQIANRRRTIVAITVMTGVMSLSLFTLMFFIPSSAFGLLMGSILCVLVVIHFIQVRSRYDQVRGPDYESISDYVFAFFHNHPEFIEYFKTLGDRTWCYQKEFDEMVRIIRADKEQTEKDSVNQTWERVRTDVYKNGKITVESLKK